MPPGIRSFQATQYVGFDASAQLVLDAYRDKEFDCIVAHSQGAILITALLALNRIPKHPKNGYILNGLAFPSPFSDAFDRTKFDASQQPRILLLVGENDTINPPEQALRVNNALIRAGANTQMIFHQGGHAVPALEGHILNDVADWITTVTRLPFGASYIGGDPW